MTTESTVDTVVVVEAAEAVTTVADIALNESLATLRAELASSQEILKKVRRFEKENKAEAEKALVEQGKFKELYEAELLKSTALEGKFRTRAIDSAVETALKDSGAKSISTLLKLIDKNRIVVEGDVVDAASIASLVKELKISDPILFAEFDAKVVPIVPAVKKAGEGDVVGGYATEMKAATTQRQIESIMRKYGKL